MPSVLVIYHSDTGNTRSLAERIAQGAAEVAGVKVSLISAGELEINDAAEADALAIGSPDYFSYVAGSVKTFFDKVLYDERFKNKPYVAFGTHGGGAKVLGRIEALAKAVGLRRVQPGLLVQGAPTREHEGPARQLGKALAEAVL